MKTLLTEDKLFPFSPTDLRGKRTLVLAPHPDDETIGCGGSLFLHAAAGDQVKVVFLTNGAKGDPKETDRVSYISRRKGEAQRACRLLGIRDLVFWDQEDRSLVDYTYGVQRLTDLILKEKPDLIYAPSPMEIHPDHRAAAFLLELSIKQLSDIDFQIAFYEIGQPLKINALVDITSVFEKKREALRCYDSQLHIRAYDEICLALNRFRSMTLSQGMSYAEGFFLSTARNVGRSSAFKGILLDMSRLLPISPCPDPDGWGNGHWAKEDEPGSRQMASVIIPTRDRPIMLRQAIESVLKQTYPCYEIIVVNDSGQDVSDLITLLDPSASKITYLQHSRAKGVSAARNTGLKRAKGSFIAYLDDDDIYYPGHLETLARALSDERFDVVYTDAEEILFERKNGEYVPTRRENKGRQGDFDGQELLVGNYIPTLCIGHKADILRSTGRFDESLDSHEDWDMWIRLSRHSTFRHVPIVTAAYTKRPDNRSKSTGDRLAFLRTEQRIRSKYAHLLTDPALARSYEEAEAFLRSEIRIEEGGALLKAAKTDHRFRFVERFTKNKTVLELAHDPDTGRGRIHESAGRAVRLTETVSWEESDEGRGSKEKFILVIGSLLHPPFKPNTFDTVICFDLPRRLDQTDSAVEEWLVSAESVLKNDGVAILGFEGTVPGDVDERTSEGTAEPPPADSGLFHAMGKVFGNVHRFIHSLHPFSALAPMGSGDPLEVEMPRVGRKSRPDGDENVRWDQILIGSHEPLAEAELRPSARADRSHDLEDLFRSVDRAYRSIVQAKDRELREVETERDHLQGHVKNLKENQDNTVQYSKGMERINHQQERHIGNLEKSLSSEREHIRNLEFELKHLRDHIGNLESERAHLTGHAGNLETEHRTQLDHIRNLEREREDLVKHIGNLESDAEQRVDHIRNLEIDRERVSAAIEAKIAEIDGLMAKIDRMEAEKTAVEVQLNHFHSSFYWKMGKRMGVAP